MTKEKKPKKTEEEKRMARIQRASMYVKETLPERVRRLRSEVSEAPLPFISAEAWKKSKQEELRQAEAMLAGRKKKRPKLDKSGLKDTDAAQPFNMDDIRRQNEASSKFAELLAKYEKAKAEFMKENGL